MHVVPPQNGPKAAPAGEYWVAYHPDYVRHDGQHVNGDSLAKIRPALHENDDVHFDEAGDLLLVKPTEHAKRWGLHQDAPRGRSRCSLTRSDTRTFEKGGLQRPVTGKWLAEYFEKKAEQDNMDLRDWLEKNIPAAALSEDDKVYLDWLEDILGDEVWQGMLFHDFTTDEVSPIAPGAPGPLPHHELTMSLHYASYMRMMYSRCETTSPSVIFGGRYIRKSSLTPAYPVAHD